VKDRRGADTDLKDVKFNLEQFDSHGVKDKLEKQVAFNEDMEFCDDVNMRIEAWLSGLDGAVEESKESFAEIESHSSKHNAPLFKKYETKLDEMRKTMTDAAKIGKSAREIQGELTKLGQELKDTKESLKEEFAVIARQLVKTLEAKGITSIEPDTYMVLTQRKATLEKKIADLEKKTSKEETKKDALLTAISKLNDAWHAEFKLIETAISKINAAQSSLKMESTFKGDKAAFVAKMDDTFRGSNIRKDSYQRIAENYADFAAIYNDFDNAAAYAKGKAEAFKELFLENLGDLLKTQVPNSYDVTYHGKSLKSHSLGQRASAMMLFLLSQDENDLLLIDQPEDDLDSQTVYGEVVKLLREIKFRQQFIFATHNANFPVLGDAELVAACRTEDEAIIVENGSIDTKTCQGKIVDIMEGGEEAFERRKTIYQTWKGSSDS
jgi:predicted ATPase